MVGGAIGLVGGWLGPSLVERRKEAAEKKRIRAEKFEEMVTAIYEFDDWLNRKENIQVFGGEEKLGSSPFAKMEAISAVYFPEFMEKTEELQKAVRNYELWMSKAWKKRVDGEIDKVNEGLLDVFNPYKDRRKELLKGLRNYASKNFQ